MLETICGSEYTGQNSPSGDSFKIAPNSNVKILFSISESLRAEKTLALASRSDDKMRIMRRKIHLFGCSRNASCSNSQQAEKIHLRVLWNAVYSPKALEETFKQT